MIRINVWKYTLNEKTKLQGIPQSFYLFLNGYTASAIAGFIMFTYD